MGSAQSRRAGYVLQHGSLPLVGDITRLIDVLALDSDTAGRLRAELSRARLHAGPGPGRARRQRAG